MKARRRVFDAHTHIGEMAAYRFYDLAAPVKPTVIEYPNPQAMLKHMDDHGVERTLIIPNYGIPDSRQPFTLNPLVVDAINHDDRFVGALWVSGLTKDAENVREALQHAGDKGIKALKATCLLGGTYKPADWDPETRAQWESIVAAAERHDLVLHLHTSPGGGSDISNALAFVQEYGKRIKVHLVHMGGGVSGHIKLVPRFLDLVRQG
ncbi:MAG TPA: amidohydrolase family protein, partial [Chloroflexota bacterium]